MESSQAHAHGDHSHGDHGHGAHGHTDYVKIYWILLVLLGVSIAGPMFGHKIVTLITAFGIAVVKAYLVASNFMHLKVEKKYISYLLLTAIAFMFLFYAGVAPDVMKHRGRQWENVAAQEWSKKALIEDAAEREHGEHGEHGGGEHGHAE
jgi:caa(3)-type oxidase subunit IV